MPRYVFQEVSITAEKTGKCRCGKQRKRRQKILQTLNPFNLDACGMPKTREQIMRELQAEAEAWRAEPIVCSKCPDEEKARGEG